MNDGTQAESPMEGIGVLHDGRKLYYADEHFTEPGYKVWDPDAKEHRRVALIVEDDPTTVQMVPVSVPLREWLEAGKSQPCRIRLDGTTLVVEEVRGDLGEGPLAPSMALISKLGSIARHLEEATGDGGLAVDVEAAKVLLSDPEVVEWMKHADAAGLLPVKRGDQ